MRRRLLSLAAVLALAGAVAYVARPAGHTPLYDANLVRLAESELEGYCAGEAFWNSQGQGSAEMARACRARESGTLAGQPSPHAVLPAFCRAVNDVGGFPIDECLEILRGQQLWPTYDGGVSNAWNRTRPYPVSGLPAGETSAGDNSRTGGRPSMPRSSPGRTTKGAE